MLPLSDKDRTQFFELHLGQFLCAVVFLLCGIPWTDIRNVFLDEAWPQLPVDDWEKFCECALREAGRVREALEEGPPIFLEVAYLVLRGLSQKEVAEILDG